MAEYLTGSAQMKQTAASASESDAASPAAVVGSAGPLRTAPAIREAISSAFGVLLFCGRWLPLLPPPLPPPLSPRGLRGGPPRPSPAGPPLLPPRPPRRPPRCPPRGAVSALGPVGGAAAGVVVDAMAGGAELAGGSWNWRCGSRGRGSFYLFIFSLPLSLFRGYDGGVSVGGLTEMRELRRGVSSSSSPSL